MAESLRAASQVHGRESKAEAGTRKAKWEQPGEVLRLPLFDFYLMTLAVRPSDITRTRSPGL
jgi:hypothetical protein